MTDVSRHGSHIVDAFQEVPSEVLPAKKKGHLCECPIAGVTKGPKLGGSKQHGFILSQF